MDSDEGRRGATLDRRSFLAGCGALLTAAGLSSCEESAAPAGPDATSSKDGPTADTAPRHEASVGASGVVVDVHDERALDGDLKYDTARVTAMLAAGLLELAKATDLKHAWKTLLPSADASTRIGIKTNQRGLCVSSPTLIKALVDTLRADLDVAPERAIVWDCAQSELKASGVTAAVVGATVLGTGASPSVVGPSNPGYDAPVPLMSTQVSFSKIFTQMTDLTINLATLKDHSISGATGALKNIFGGVEKPGELHDGLSVKLPALNALGIVRDRMRLYIIEAIQAVAFDGPNGPVTHTPRRLLLSTDPLAVDVHAIALLNQLRGAKNPIPTAMLGWVDEASRLGLGSKTPQVRTLEMG